MPLRGCGGQGTALWFTPSRAAGTELRSSGLQDKLALEGSYEGTVASERASIVSSECGANSPLGNKVKVVMRPNPLSIFPLFVIP